MVTSSRLLYLLINKGFINQLNYRPMKKTLLSVITLITLSLSYAQDNSVAFKVTNFEIDGLCFDNLALNGDVALAFYMCDKETLCFANYWRNKDSQSYGGVYGLKSTDIPETETTYPAEVFRFTWKFYNTYDDVKGEAAVTFTKIYIHNTVKFVAEILVLDTNSVLKMKGYQE